ncbi:MAG: acyl-CoA dehydrogenase family protein [Acidimicrobiia bacterium]
MDLRPSDTDQLLADQARALLSAEADPERLTAWEAGADGFDRPLWARLVDLGWPSVAFPEAAGGGGGSLSSLGVLATEVGRAAFPSLFLAVAGAGLVAARLGTTKRASAVLESICRDGAPVSLLWVPGCGARLVAERRGEVIRVSGRVVGEWAHLAETLVCLAPMAGAEMAAVALDATAPNVRIGPRRSFDNERVALVELDGVEAGVDDHLVPGGVLPAGEVADVLGAVRLVRAAELVGMAEKILEMTASYVTTRIQFGVPLGTFQAVQHACADVATLVHGARLATDEGLSGDRSVRKAGALAGWLAGRAAVAAAVTGAQLHGGVGMIRDYPLHFYYRRAKAMQLRLGSAAEQLEELAQVLVDPVAATGGAPAPWL